tara:strand:+ start:557 stop:745 length:189 start_codon:yes stop_codon:yes gene_type:complete
MNKVIKVLSSLVVMAVVTNIIISIGNFYNIPQTDYLLYLLWIVVLIIFFGVLPKNVNIEDYY